MRIIVTNYSAVAGLHTHARARARTHTHTHTHIYIYIYDKFVNCNSVDSRWQYYSTHLHTDNTQNNTNNNRTTQFANLEDCGPCPRFCEFYPGICLTTEEKTRENLNQGKKNLSQGTVHILPKHPHITKPTHIHTHTLTHSLTHTHTHTRIYLYGVLSYCTKYI